jgi:hypothetical protein
MPFNFPASPTVGQQSIQNGRAYQWNGSAWELVAITAPHTHLAGEVTSGVFDIARIPTGSDSISVCIGDDARLSNARTPTAHVHSGADITSGVVAAARIGAHATTHSPGGSDAVSLAQPFIFTRSSAPATATTVSAGRYDWTIPTGARAISIEAVGGGGGGGSGRRGAANALRYGGGGGTGGSRSITTVSVAELPTTTLSIQVGRGAVGGAAVTTDDTNGNNGESNTLNGSSWVRYNQSVFGVSSVLLQAGAGGSGNGGTNASGTATSGWAGTFAGGTGGASTGTTGSTAGETSAAPSGGGGGGTLSATNTAAGGGAGGRVSMFSATLFGGTGASVAGANGDNAPSSTILVAGQGGGGGASNASGTGGSGGNGGFPGGAGGGGGASPNTFNSGAGGNGADGMVRITVWY